MNGLLKIFPEAISQAHNCDVIILFIVYYNDESVGNITRVNSALWLLQNGQMLRLVYRAHLKMSRMQIG